MKLISFLGEKFFFISINDTIKMTKTNTRIKKSNWPKYPKIYLTLYQTKLNNKNFIGRLKLDYKFEQQSYKTNK